MQRHENHGVSYNTGGAAESSKGDYTNPTGYVEYSSSLSTQPAGSFGTPFMFGGVAGSAAAANPTANAANRTITALDFEGVPSSTDADWAENTGMRAKARFYTDIAISGFTSLAADPEITFRGYVRNGGSTGVVGAADSVAFTRPRVGVGSTNIVLAKTTDLSSAGYTVYSSVLTDASTATGASLRALPAAASSAYFLIGYKSTAGGPFCGLDVNMDASAINAADTTFCNYKYWNGTAWTTLTGIVDGTKASSKVLAQDGQVSWQMPADWAVASLTSLAISAYWIQGSVTTALTTVGGQEDILLAELGLLFPIKAAIDVQADGDDAMLCLESVTTGLAGTGAYSGSVRVSWR